MILIPESYSDSRGSYLCRLEDDTRVYVDLNIGWEDAEALPAEKLDLIEQEIYVQRLVLYEAIGMGAGFLRNREVK
jgi:hypothetical protein